MLNDSIFKELNHSYAGYTKYANGGKIPNGFEGYKPDFVLANADQTDFVIFESEVTTNRKTYIGNMVKAAEFLSKESKRTGTLVIVMQEHDNTKVVQIVDQLKHYYKWMRSCTNLKGVWVIKDDLYKHPDQVNPLPIDSNEFVANSKHICDSNLDAMNELEELLHFSDNLDLEVDAKIKATYLMTSYVIKKRVDNVETQYYLNNIELYYYSPKHKDTCVHPHYFKKAGSFRVHFSGVDITFASNLSEKAESDNTLREKLKKAGNYPSLEYKVFMKDQELTYGGFLIREIQEVGTKKPIKGPLCVLCELFNFEGEALHLTIEKGEPRDIKIKTDKRKNLGKNAGPLFAEKEYAFIVE